MLLKHVHYLPLGNVDGHTIEMFREALADITERLRKADVDKLKRLLTNVVHYLC